MNIIKKIKEYLGYVDYCPICLQTLTEHGFYGQRDCMTEWCKNYYYKDFSEI